MSNKRKGMIKVPEKVNMKAKTESKHTFVMPEVFKRTNDVIKIEILPCDERKWYSDLVGLKINAIDWDFDCFFACDYQDKTKPHLRFIVQKEDAKIIG